MLQLKKESDLKKEFSTLYGLKNIKAGTKFTAI